MPIAVASLPMRRQIMLEFRRLLRLYFLTAAKFNIPIIYTSTNRELATERAASWLSKHFTYWWLEEHGYGRVLVDSDGL